MTARNDALGMTTPVERRTLIRVETACGYPPVRSGMEPGGCRCQLRSDRGVRVGIVGESGSGKSISALSILRLIDPRALEIGAQSRVWFGGKDILHAPISEVRQLRGSQISMVFQDPMSSLNPVFKIGRQISQVIRTHRPMSRIEAREVAAEALDWVHITDPGRVLNSYPHQLSGGMLQRAMIAMAIVSRPRLLICDEPTSALDVTVQRAVLATFEELVDRLGMTLLLISHDIGVIAGTCDYVYVMYGGRVVEGGPVEEVLRRPRHPYTYQLLKCEPRLFGEETPRLEAIPGVQRPRLGKVVVEGCQFSTRCRFAEDRCHQITPPTETFADRQGSVACHRWREMRFENID